MNIQEMQKNAGAAAVFLKAIANPARLMLLCELLKGEKSAGALEDAVALSQSAVSQHLAKLRAAGLVRTRRDAQTIYYTLNDSASERIIKVLYDEFCADDQNSGKAGAKCR